METLYETLDVDADATHKEIKAAYRDLSNIHHPDKGGNPEEFVKLSKAYMVLCDTRRRKRYDETGIKDDARHTNNLANGLLQRMFSDLLDTHGAHKILKIDVVSAIKKNLAKIIVTAETQKEEFLNKNKELEKVLLRIIHKNEQNLFVDIIKNQIQGNAGQYTDLCQSIETTETAQDILHSYDFQFDAEPEKRVVNIFPGSISFIHST